MAPEGEREDRFRIAVSILIALVAVTGALISWKILRINDRASSFDSDAIKAALAEANTEISISSDIHSYQNFFQSYSLHLRDARLLKGQLQANPSLPSRLWDEWQREIIRANVYRNQLDQDYLEKRGEEEFFDASRYHEAFRAEAASQKALDSGRFTDLSDIQRQRARRFTSLSILLALALFFFTLALKTDDSWRTAWAAVGACLYGGTVLLTIGQWLQSVP